MVRAHKRAGQLAEAEVLLLSLIEAVEAEARLRSWGIAPWYYNQLAIIYRKQKRYADEVAILERRESLRRPTEPIGPEDASRLNKARLLLERALASEGAT